MRTTQRVITTIVFAAILTGINAAGACDRGGHSNGQMAYNKYSGAAAFNKGMGGGFAGKNMAGENMTGNLAKPSLGGGKGGFGKPVAGNGGTAKPVGGFSGAGKQYK